MSWDQLRLRFIVSFVKKELLTSSVCGFILGPGIGAYFARSGNYSIPALACLILSATSFFIILFFLDETLDSVRCVFWVAF
jgi:Mg/Co/Ni transporter MgtE